MLLNDVTSWRKKNDRDRVQQYYILGKYIKTKLLQKVLGIGMIRWVNHL
jgi:hypothetical protein